MHTTFVEYLTAKRMEKARNLLRTSELRSGEIALAVGYKDPHYFSGIGFSLEGGNGYYYFSRQENKVELADKVQRMAEWIDKTDFLKTFNTAFGSGFTFRKSNILEKFSSDIELKEKARRLYTDLKTNDEKIDKLIGDLQRQGFVELQDELDGTFKVRAAFHYIEELIDCLTIIETETEQA